MTFIRRAVTATAAHSNPIVSGTTPVGWTAGFLNGGSNTYTAAVYAICAKTG